jgi:hypothetical protein
VQARAQPNLARGPFSLQQSISTLPTPSYPHTLRYGYFPDSLLHLGLCNPRRTFQLTLLGTIGASPIPQPWRPPISSQMLRSYLAATPWKARHPAGLPKVRLPHAPDLVPPAKSVVPIHVNGSILLFIVPSSNDTVNHAHNFFTSISLNQLQLGFTSTCNTLSVVMSNATCIFGALIVCHIVKSEQRDP